MKYLICKKELFGDRIFRSGNEYEIGQMFVSSQNNEKSLSRQNCFMLTDEYTNDPAVTKGLWFGPQFGNKVTDYFYTKQELRKIKLQKLNEIPNL